MENNYTTVQEFYIVTFSANTDDQPLVFILFFFLYVTGVVVNSAVITVISLDPHLHTPLYLFLYNLSIVDISSTTVIIPKLLDMLLSGSNIISWAQCFTQVYFFFLSGGSEDLLLFTMAYDRYVAICRPLHYSHVFRRTNCILMVVGIWVSSDLNSVLFTLATSNMSFCRSNVVQQFYCDAKALTKISCGGTQLFYIVTCLEIFIFGICPFLCSFMSYMKMIKIILQIKSKDGRRKAFSTCSSHLTVIVLYYTTGVCVYMMPPSAGATTLDVVFTVLFTTVTPMLNPLIYSLRNHEVKVALKRLIGVKIYSERDFF